MNTCPDDAWIQDFLKNPPDEGQPHWFHDHVEECTACQQALERLTKTEPDAWARNADEALPANPAFPRIDGYEIECCLGAGSFGLVYRARSIKLGHVVALKWHREVAAAHGPGQPADFDPVLLARVKLEAEVLARLNHPGIVRIFEFGMHAGRPYLVLEYVDGGTLADRLFQTAPGDTAPHNGSPTATTPNPVSPRSISHRIIAPVEAARLIKTLAEAVHRAHQEGIIHRDLKPANILLQGRPNDPLENCQPKITDFGLAMRIDQDATRLTQASMGGTPLYMAPEQAANQRPLIGPATDIYALGVILYEMLTGRMPLEADSADELREKLKHATPVSPRTLNPDIPKDLETICLHCLHK
ncbi:MAG: serine/threonine protein kinase, partial [Planctomycetes bacterium]|nr:serine/threonine protein kinase [Planctomycetota bacterium]